MEFEYNFIVLLTAAQAALKAQQAEDFGSIPLTAAQAALKLLSISGPALIVLTAAQAALKNRHT